MERNNLAERLDVCGRVLVNKDVVALLQKFDRDMTTAEIKGVTLSICSILLKNENDLCDSLVMLHMNCTKEEAQQLDDKKYTKNLMSAILTDVLSFFG